MSVQASVEDVLRLRLASHGLARSEFATPLEVAQRMLAVQAQDYPAGRWALGVRAPGTTEATVTQAIDAGLIVRSWPMRGTLHLVPAPELGWMLRLTTPRLLAAGATRRRQLGIDDDTVEAARAAAVSALAGGRRLSRPAFLRMLEESGISIEGQRGYHIIGQLAQTGTLCWGPHEGKQQALVLLDEWVPHPRILDRDEALGEFLLRYLAGHGPATLKDFVWWSKLTVAEAKTGLAVVASRLTELRVGDTTYYLPAEAEVGESGSRPRQRVPVLPLPPFDEYLLGYGDRSLVIEDENLPKVFPGKNGIFLPILVESGRVTGLWRAPTAGSTMRASLDPFDGIGTRRHTDFASVMAEYANFRGSAVTVTGERPGAPELT